MHDLIGLVAVIMPFTIPLFIFWTKHQRRMADHTLIAYRHDIATFLGFLSGLRLCFAIPRR